VFPALRVKNADTRRIRVWSAGCSTGEEPYSLAITIREAFPEASQWDVKILATDLDSNVVAHASNGIYSREKLNGISDQRLRKWFRRSRSGDSDSVKVSSELQSLITFKQLNLMHEWPMRGPFDFIFCRNVVIYFDKDTQRVLFSRYADYLTDEGHLFIGHSESLYKVSDKFRLIGGTMYQKKV